MVFNNLPLFIAIPLCFEAGCAICVYALKHWYRFRFRRQTSNDDVNDFELSHPVEKTIQRLFEVSFAGTHLIPLMVLTSRSPHNSASVTPVLLSNGVLLASILYFLI